MTMENLSWSSFYHTSIRSTKFKSTTLLCRLQTCCCWLCPLLKSTASLTNLWQLAETFSWRRSKIIIIGPFARTVNIISGKYRCLSKYTLAQPSPKSARFWNTAREYKLNLRRLLTDACGNSWLHSSICKTWWSFAFFFYAKGFQCSIDIATRLWRSIRNFWSYYVMQTLSWQNLKSMLKKKQTLMKSENMLLNFTSSNGLNSTGIHTNHVKMSGESLSRILKMTLSFSSRLQT